jgi:hypothetical protein
MDKKKLEKLKQRVEKFREKHKHAQKDVKGVKHPNRSHKQAKAAQPKAKQPKAVGPKGGVYTPTVSGKKDYQKSLAGNKMDNKIQNFIEEMKMKKEEVKKAVTAEAATTTVKTDDATLNGENKPAIQDAKTQTEIQAEAAKPAAEPAAAAPAQPEPAKEPAKKEVSFDGLFANDYVIGATLRQNPNGGNVMSNMKKPSMDYVDRAKNHKNVSMTSEELSQVKPPVVQTKQNKK